MYIFFDFVKIVWCIIGKIKNFGIYYKIIGLVDLIEYNVVVKVII